MDTVGKRNDFLEKRQAVTAAGASARRRIDLLLDSGSFMEIGAFVKQRPTEFGAADAAAEGVVTGWGTIDGAPVCVFSQDVDALGGAVSEMHAQKITTLYEYALKTGIPVIGFFDSKGARLAEGVDALNGYARILACAAKASAQVPQIAVISGICGGAASMVAESFDFVVAVKGGELYMNSPAVIAAVTEAKGVSATAEDAAKNGNASFYAEDDASAAATVRALISMLPSNSAGDRNYAAASDDINRLADLNAMGDGSSRAVLAQIADNGTSLEAGAPYAPEILTAFARFDGETVGVIGADGVITMEGIGKAASFLSFCDTFGISVLTIVNASGFEMSPCFEKFGGMSKAASLAAAYATAETAMITLITGKATGSAYVAFGARGLGCDMAFAWPQAEISAIAAPAAVDLFRLDDIKKAADPIQKRAELEAEFAEKTAAPYEAAKRGYVDEVIDPTETRQAIVYALGLFSTKNVSGR